MLTKRSQSSTIAENSLLPIQYTDGELALEFVGQYYSLLSQCPSMLIQFYREESSMSYLEECDRSDSKVCCGLDAIEKNIETIGFTDCKVTVSSLDCIKSIGNSLLIMVLGDLKFADTYRRFSQTFLMAVQPEGFFILNDICRYFHYDASEIDGLTAAPQIQPTETVVPSKDSVIVESKAPLHPEAQAKTESSGIPSSIEPAQLPVFKPENGLPQGKEKVNIDSERVKSSTINPLAGPFIPKSSVEKVEVNGTSNLQFPDKLQSPSQASPPSSWASLIAQKDASQWGKLANTNVVGQSVSNSPRPSVSPSSAHSSEQAQFSDSSYSKPSSSHAQANGKSKPKYNYLKCLYVKGITKEVDDFVLRREFGRGGKVVDIQRQASFAIVEYESEEAAKNAMKIDYHYEGKKLAVEPKRQQEKARLPKSSSSSQSHNPSDHSRY